MAAENESYPEPVGFRAPHPSDAPRGSRGSVFAGGAPLRAWAWIDPAMAAGTVALDARGRAVLQEVDAGARLHARSLHVPRLA